MKLSYILSVSSVALFAFAFTASEPLADVSFPKVSGWVSETGCTIQSLDFQGLLPGSRLVEAQYDSKGIGDRSAHWTISGNTLTLKGFDGHPEESYTARVDGTTMIGAHTWKQNSVMHSEQCTFTQTD